MSTLEEKVLRTAETLTDKVANLPDCRRIQTPRVTPKDRTRSGGKTKRAARRGRLPVVLPFVPAA